MPKTIFVPCAKCGTPRIAGSSPSAIAKVLRRPCNACNKRPLADRFWEKVDKNGSVVRPDLGPCWIWTGASLRSGHGVLNSGKHGSNLLAHRTAFFLKHGRWPIPNANHHCDNPPCVRWEHLYEGDQADNARDCSARGRRVTSRGELSGKAKLSAQDAINVFCSLEYVNDTAARYGISRGAVTHIWSRRTWRHVTDAFIPVTRRRSAKEVHANRWK
jgi:HNH endonuclease